MKRSDILIQCLINSGCNMSRTDIEHGIRTTFADYYPKHNYSDWDVEVTDNAANHIIRVVGRASDIKVDLFIRDLWDVY